MRGRGSLARRGCHGGAPRHDFGEETTVRPAIHHELRQGFGGVQGEVALLFERTCHVESTGGEPRFEALAVRRRRDDQERLTGVVARPEVGAQRVEEVGILLVEPHEVLGVRNAASGLSGHLGRTSL